MADAVALDRAGVPSAAGVLARALADQGRGLGVRVCEPILARCDDTRTLSWLESTNPRNHAFYRRLGFAVAHETPIPAGPTLTFFARSPR